MDVYNYYKRRLTAQNFTSNELLHFQCNEKSETSEVHFVFKEGSGAF